MSGAPTAPTPDLCPSCGTPRPGRFCGACGEKRVDPGHDHSLAHWVAEFFEGLTHFDGRFFRTFRTLVTAPGRLTRDHLLGRRVGAMAPLQLFFVVSVVFYLCFTHAYAAEAASMSQNLANGSLLGNLFRVDVLGVLQAKATQRQQPLEELVALVRERAGHHSKLFLATLLPVWALCLQGLGRLVYSKFVPHLIFAVHELCTFLIFDLVFLLVHRVLGHRAISDTMFVPLLVAFWAHLLLALRGAYGFSWPGAIWRSVVALAGLVATILVYRQAVTVVTSLLV